jgi:hypothetical protein
MKSQKDKSFRANHSLPYTKFYFHLFIRPSILPEIQLFFSMANENTVFLQKFVTPKVTTKLNIIQKLENIVNLEVSEKLNIVCV